ncbi:hypothetical protein ACFY78_10805 [Streptomyces olindensis]|uniref:hypothetical protein n=1 Tax=Streptomyces olindensis TaxID=358823 RepID=UPI00369300E3
MTAITKIIAEVHTSGVDHADTRSAVWLGIAGREFRLSTGRDRDFSLEAEATFTLGEDTNVENPEQNDPRNPALATADLDRYPVYIRMDGSEDAPHWCLEDLKVTVNPGPESHEFADPRLDGRGDGRRIWLDNPFGNILHLRRTAGITDQAVRMIRGNILHLRRTAGIADQAVRIVRGNIQANGSKEQIDADDFQVTHVDKGHYKIAFTQPFATTATLVATAFWQQLGQCRGPQPRCQRRGHQLHQSLRCRRRLRLPLHRRRTAPQHSRH